MTVGVVVERLAYVPIPYGAVSVVALLHLNVRRREPELLGDDLRVRGLVAWPSRRGNLDTRGESTVQTLHRADGLTNSRRPSLGVDPTPRHGKTDPRSALVVQTLPVEFASEIGLDGLAVAVQSVEQGLVLLSVGSVDIKLHPSLMLQDHVIPPLPVFPRADPVYSARRNPCVEVRHFVRLGKEGTPEVKAQVAPVPSAGNFRHILMVLDQFRRGGLLPFEIQSRRIPHPLGDATSARI